MRSGYHEQRRIAISDEELEARLADWVATVNTPSGSYEYLFHTHVQSADSGADFDILVGRGAAFGKDSQLNGKQDCTGWHWQDRP